MTTTHRNRLLTTISNTPGSSGALTISSAQAGYRTFTAGDDGLSFDVSIVDGTAWEIRTGCVYTNAGTSLSRGTLVDSSTGSAIALTSSAVVTDSPTAAFATALEYQLDRAFTSITNNGVATQTFGATGTKIAGILTTVVSNPYSWWDTTNKKFLPTRAGNYLVCGALQNSSTTAQLQANIQKNTSVTAVAGLFQAAAQYVVSTVCGVVYLNGTTDYVELYGYQSTSGVVGASSGNNFVNFLYLGP